MFHFNHTKGGEQENWKHVHLDFEQSPTKVKNSRSNSKNKHSQKIIKRNERIFDEGNIAIFYNKIESVKLNTYGKYARHETQKEVRLKDFSNEKDSKSKIKGINHNYSQLVKDIYEHHDILVATYCYLNSISNVEDECNMKKTQRYSRLLKLKRSWNKKKSENIIWEQGSSSSMNKQSDEIKWTSPSNDSPLNRILNFDSPNKNLNNKPIHDDSK